MTSEAHNLGVFKILYIIKGIIILAFSLLPLLFMVLGVHHLHDHDLYEEDASIGGIMLLSIGCLLFLFLMILGILTLLMAKFISEKRNYDFILVMAIINCLTGILGIILGIFMILELNKPEVKRLFGKPA